MSIDTISQTFGLPVDIEEPKLPVVIQDSYQPNSDDKEEAKATVRRLLTKSESALDEMMEIAKATEHPRAFEVAKQLIDATANLAKQLTELAKVEEAKEVKSTTNIANAQTVVFTGSPTELLARMKELKNNDSSSA